MAEDCDYSNSSLDDHSNPFPFMEEDHSFQHHSYNDDDDDDVQDRFIWNPTVQLETPEIPFAPPRNIDLPNHQGSGSRWLDMDQLVIHNLESHMEGLSLGNPNFGNTHSYRNSNSMTDDRTNFDPVLLCNRNSNSMSHGYGVIGSYCDNYRPIMNPSGSFVGSQQVQQSLEALRGKVVSMAKDQCGCRFLQMMIDCGRQQDIQMILSEVNHHVHALMTHHFGNYLIQKIFETRTVTVPQMNSIIYSVIRDVRKLKHVCMNNHGTRIVQRMIENLKTPTQIYAVLCVMFQITVPLMTNVNGGYVIQQCVKLFPPDYKIVILAEIARNCVEIATNKRGCSVIQKCMEHAGVAILPLVEAIISNAAVIAEDQFGNYVMNFLVNDIRILPVNANIISELRGKYVQLSINKHASNVVQNLLQCSEYKDAAIIVLEIMNSNEFLNVLQDPYGNYVSQTALKFSKGRLRRRLLNSIISYSENLSSHPYGKRVLDCAKLKIRFYGSQNSFWALST